MSLEEWKKHFISMSKGHKKPDAQGIWRFSESKSYDSKNTKANKLTLVSNTEQAVDQARDKVINTSSNKKRKNTSQTTSNTSSKRVKKSIAKQKKKEVKKKATVFDKH